MDSVTVHMLSLLDLTEQGLALLSQAVVSKVFRIKFVFLNAKYQMMSGLDADTVLK